MTEGSTKTLKQPHVQHSKLFTLTFLPSEPDNAGAFRADPCRWFPADGLFVGVVISNSVIGVSQEIYARRELEKLQLLNSPSVRVIRNGAEEEVAADEVVQDDLVVTGAGDQIVVDGDVLETQGLKLTSRS